MARNYGITKKPVSTPSTRGSGISIPSYRFRPKFGITNSAYPKSRVAYTTQKPMAFK